MTDIHSKRLADSHTKLSFIGGSDARIIVGQDENALIRLWQAKQCEVGPFFESWHPVSRSGDAAIIYFPGLLCIRLRSLTPGPPPFSSMNSMPAFSRAASILSPVSVRPPNGPS